MRRVSHDQACSSIAPAPERTKTCIISVRLSRQLSSVCSEISIPMTLNASGTLPARTRLYSAGVTRRLVRSPAAPKIVIVAGGAWRREPDVATVDEGVGAMVFASLILLPVIDAVWRLGAGSLGGLSTTQAAP